MNSFDVELLEGTFVLGEFIMVRIVVIDLVNPTPIRVKAQGTTMEEQIGLERTHDAVGALSCEELKPDGTAGGIVNERDQGTGRSPPFKPVMEAAVDLNHFTKTGFGFPIDVRVRFLHFRFPDAFPDHEMTKGFVVDRETMTEG